MQTRFLDHQQLAALAAPLQRHLADHCEVDIGGFEAQALAALIAERIGPLIYNQALADARQVLDARMVSLQEALWELERELP